LLEQKSTVPRQPATISTDVWQIQRALNFALKLEELSMKKLIIASLVGGAFVVPALAADLAPAPRLYTAPPPLALPWSWTGFYIGSNFGWIGSTDNTITNTGTDNGPGGLGTYLSFGGIPATVSASHSNFLSGGQIGYNWQWGPSWVLGLEADFDGIASPSSTVVAAFPGNAAFAPAQSGFSRALDDLGTADEWAT
jgi:outer membrane immunogenic protein